MKDKRRTRPITVYRTGKLLSSDPSSMLPAVNIHLQKWSRASGPVAVARRVSARSRDGSGVGDGHPRRALGDSRSTGRLRGLSLGLCRWRSNICSNYPSSIGRWRSRDGCRNGRHLDSCGCGHGRSSSSVGWWHGGRSSGFAVGGEGTRRRVGAGVGSVGVGGGGARGRRSQRRRLCRTSFAGYPDVVGTGPGVHLRGSRQCGRGARCGRGAGGGRGAVGAERAGRRPEGRGGGGCGGGGAGLRWRCGWGVVEVRLRCGKGGAEVLQRWGLGGAEVAPSCG